MPPTVFVDTSALCALFNSRDTLHNRAKKTWNKILAQEPNLVISDYIFDETVTLLRKRAQHDTAKKGGEALLKSQAIHWAHVNETIISTAWKYFIKYHDHHLSFTDCTSFVLMQENKIQRVWSFDSDFDFLGFERIS